MEESHYNLAYMNYTLHKNSEPTETTFKSIKAAKEYFNTTLRNDRGFDASVGFSVWMRRGSGQAVGDYYNLIDSKGNKVRY